MRIRMMISELNALRVGGAGCFFVFPCLFVLMEERREMAWKQHLRIRGTPTSFSGLDVYEM